MNRLSGQTSPYLRQHADNPVDWYPWGPEALAAAKDADKPILLSVGYSACHWCHVMAHESFEDEATAAVMNQSYINIKVDREERPDIDAIYMDAVQSMTGRGGWPMTVFLTPEGVPFFGGTYFPPTSRGGMPAFIEILQSVSNAWSDNRGAVDQHSTQLLETLGQSSQVVPGVAIAEENLLVVATNALQDSYDREWGGFGTAPKFPQTMNLELLLRSYQHSNDQDVLEAVTNSLDAMAAGGIYDHLGGGFSRYSTDTQWLVPHFEKMLYDNALLVRTYLHGWQVTGRSHYLQVVEETISYVLRDLRDPAGGFYAAEDADSEGVEGKFYAWSPHQIHLVLGDDASEFANWYGVTDEGNFEGHNILCRPVRGELARPASIELSRQRLFQAREMRIRPGLDNKVLTEWNGLMLATLAEAALVTSNHQWLSAAVKNGDFLLANLRRDDGRWLRSWQPQAPDHHAEARHLGYAADIAAVVDGFVRLSEATGEHRWVDVAITAADQLLELFWDDQNGGVFTTGSDADALIIRPKDLTDGAVPSANSAAASALMRLGTLTGIPRYVDRAHDILLLLSEIAVRQPAALGHLVGVIDMVESGMTEIVIPGSADDLLDVVRPRFLPNAVLAWGEPGDSPLWQDRHPGNAYVCQGFSCGVPAKTTVELAAQLDALAGGGP